MKKFLNKEWKITAKPFVSVWFIHFPTNLYHLVRYLNLPFQHIYSKSNIVIYIVIYIYIYIYMGGRWPYSWCLVECCRQDLFSIARNILVQLPFSFFSRRQLHKNVASNIEQVLAATSNKAPTIRPPASHHENYPS